MMKEAESREKGRKRLNQRQTARVKREGEISKEQSRNQTAKWEQTQGEGRKFRKMRRRGNESRFWQPLGQSDLESPRHSRQQRHSKIHHYFGRQSDVVIVEENRRFPQNSVQMSPSYFIGFFLTLIFFQFNYSVNLINRYDCSVCNLCARHLICSGSGHWEALVGIVFPLSWWPAL